MHFLSDITEKDRRFRVFTIVDDFTRRCVALLWTSHSHEGASWHYLANSASCRRRSSCENGPQFASQALDQRAFANKVRQHFTRPGKPADKIFNQKLQRQYTRSEASAQPWRGCSIVEMISAPHTATSTRKPPGERCHRRVHRDRG